MSLTQTTVENRSATKTKVVSLDELSGKQLTGAWKFNRAESENALEKLRYLFPSPEKDSGSDDKQAEISALAVLLFPCETMVLAGDETRITVTEKFKRLVQVRTFIPDSQGRPQKQNSSIEFTVTAVLKKDLLTIETASPGGYRLIETYELLPDSGKLKGVVRIVDPERKEIVVLRRSFDRTVLDIFFGDEKDMD